MRKFLILLTVFLSSYIFLKNSPSLIYSADHCTHVVNQTLTPAGPEGKSSTEFTITGTVLDGNDSPCEYLGQNLHLDFASPDVNDNDEPTEQLQTDGAGTGNFSKVFLLPAGKWDVSLTDNIGPITLETPIHLEISQDDKALECGDPISKDEADSKCPQKCPGGPKDASDPNSAWVCGSSASPGTFVTTAPIVIPGGKPPCLEGFLNGNATSSAEGYVLKDYDTCTKVDSAFGPISTEPAQFITRILGLVLGMAGGIALLLIIFAGYRLIVSQGNPDSIKAARETLTSAIVGLLFIIFSIVILEIIGVDILQIPGFGRVETTNSQNQNPNVNHTTN